MLSGWKLHPFLPLSAASVQVRSRGSMLCSETDQLRHPRTSNSTASQEENYHEMYGLFLKHRISMLFKDGDAKCVQVSLRNQYHSDRMSIFSKAPRLGNS